MIDCFERLIGENTYTITQLPARRALRLQAKLFKLLSPSLSILLSPENENMTRHIEMVPKSLSLLSESLDDKTFDLLVIEIMQGVRRNGKEITDKTIDLEFAGELNELFLVMKEVLEVNYGDFFRQGGIIHQVLA